MTAEQILHGKSHWSDPKSHVCSP